MKWLYASMLALLVGPIGCDEDKGDDGGDDNSDMTSSSEEEEGSAEAGMQGCVDGENTTPVGQTRSCMCTDGSASTQTCLSTGEFGICDCQGW
jgi:hypothetical protein